LVDSSKVEARRNLPAPSHAIAPRDRWRTHDRVVPALSEIDRSIYLL
jgi:hypothetical protein